MTIITKNVKKIKIKYKDNIIKYFFGKQRYYYLELTEQIFNDEDYFKINFLTFKYIA